MDTNTTAAPKAASFDAIDVCDKLTRIKDLNQLMFMAGEGMLNVSRQHANAICAGSDTISDLLRDVSDLLDGRTA